MKKGRKSHKIPFDNYPIQTLVSLSFNPSEPSSSEQVELHVFYVPEGSWNYKLNTISIEVVNKYISAGFLRVSPHLTLQALREHLGEFLGEDAVAEKFLFLKCIGDNLAVVKAKQESELKLKSFIPPYALQPELYLLPIMDHLGNTHSASAVALDEQQADNGVAEDMEIACRPVSISRSKEEPGTDPSFLKNTLKELLNKNEEEASAEGRDTLKKKQTGKNQFVNYELPGSLEDSNDDCFSTKTSQFLWENDDNGVKGIGRNESQIAKKRYIITLPDVNDFPSLPCQPDVFPGITEISLFQMERQKITKQMKQVKEERKSLEKIREELVKVEKLYERSILKQYHAYDSWEKKYFETKKVTTSLEEVLTKLREDLELYYKKLLMQLEAREVKMRPKNMANISDSKNHLIIQITEAQHAIDQLKRKSDTEKMKFIIEAKMRQQAISDVCSLKAELTQNKINKSLQSLLASLELEESPKMTTLKDSSHLVNK